MILWELYRAIWAPFSDIGGRHWSHSTAILIQTGHSVNSVHVHNGLALSIDWVLFRVSDFTVSPVFLADDMTLGLQNIKCDIEDNSCLPMLHLMDIGETIKAENVTLSAVQVDFVHSFSGSTACYSIFARTGGQNIHRGPMDAQEGHHQYHTLLHSGATVLLPDTVPKSRWSMEAYIYDTIPSVYC